MKIVEYDRLARQPCRGRAAGVDHLSYVSELPLLDKQRRSRPIRALLDGATEHWLSQGLLRAVQARLILEATLGGVRVLCARYMRILR